VRLYDRFFHVPAPDKDKEKDFKSFINPDSLTTITAYVEPGLSSAKPGDQFQFQRLGYFVLDQESTSQELVFNKTVGLRDTWSKQNN
jgi:glutaminyl-tRNA synthetase